MSYDPQQPAEKKSLFGVIVHSFFVVPFLIAVFAVLFFIAMRILTMEARTVYDYLEDVTQGSANKRWQSAFELSRQLANPDRVPREGKFIDAMIKAYQASKHDDPRVRQYLILAMGRCGYTVFGDVLLKDLNAQENPEILYAIIQSLGILKHKISVPSIIKYLNHDHQHIRLVAVIALGQMGDPQAIEPLKQLLGDPEPNIVWDTAIALKKLGNDAGKPILLKLLDRQYLSQFPNVTIVEQSKIIMTVLQVLSSDTDAVLMKKLKQLFDTDSNMHVRSMAKKILDNR